MKKYTFFLLFLFFAVNFSSCSKDEEPKPTDPQTQKDIETIDNMVKVFLQTYNIPGASLAMSKNGKLVYQKGYGLADVQGNENMTVNHRFRVASVSKPFTGVAIMRLVQAGEISLDDQVFGEGRILGTKFGTQPYSDFTTSITVRHLLQMTSGGWVLANDGDAIDAQQTFSNEAYFNWMLDNAFIKYPPGTRYWYINTNYFVAARVIEEVSGKPFFDFMRDDFLGPLGIESAIMAQRGLNNRADMEVRYYGQGITSGLEYNFNIERRDGDAGMVISAPDLLRFVLAIDGKPSRPNILQSHIHSQFIQPSGPAPLSPIYGNGIVNWNQRLLFYGSLPGVRSSFMTETNGMALALLFNGNVDYTNAPVNDAFVQAHQNLIIQLLNLNPNIYQDIDQFED